MTGFRNKTDEEIASEGLFDYFFYGNKAIVHSWHPPDSKAYFTQLLQIPFIGEEGNRTSGRDHIDLIIQIDDFLLLVEVKGSLSESSEDIAKLKRIRKNYSLERLIEIFKNQGENFVKTPSELILVIGVRYIDCDLPTNMPVFQFNDEFSFHGTLPQSLIEKL